MFACIHISGSAVFERLLDCARAFSPLIERTGPRTVTLDAGGLGRVIGSPKQIAHAIARRAAELDLDASVAISANPDASILAARGRKGITVIAPGTEAAVLGPLPLHLLPLDEDLLDLFDAWGIRSFADLARLPETGLAARFGQNGLYLWKLARGQARRPLLRMLEARFYSESAELEYPLDNLEPLCFLLARQLSDVCGRLAEQSLAVRQLRLRLRLCDGQEHARALTLPVPVRDTKLLLKLLQLDLETHPPEAAIVAVALAADPEPPRTVQHGLFVPQAPEPAKLRLTLARVAKMVGEQNVGAPEILDTHRPDAFRLVEFSEDTEARRGRRAADQGVRPTARLALRYFRPPWPAVVETRADTPIRVSARTIRGAVAAIAGPWRGSGNWWTSTAWSREEWDIALNDALYRLYRESGRWFVDGRYD